MNSRILTTFGCEPGYEAGWISLPLIETSEPPTLDDIDFKLEPVIGFALCNLNDDETDTPEYDVVPIAAGGVMFEYEIVQLPNGLVKFACSSRYGRISSFALSAERAKEVLLLGCGR